MERNLEKESFAHQCYYTYQVQKLYKFENDIYNRLNFSANNSIQWCFIITCCYQISKYQEKSLLCHDIWSTKNLIICPQYIKSRQKFKLPISIQTLINCLISEDILLNSLPIFRGTSCLSVLPEDCRSDGY